MSSDNYQCKVCGTKYEYQQKKKSCERQHNSSVTDHTDSDEIKKLEGMTKALRKNNYDVEHTTTDKTEQRTLRNQKVRKKKLNDF